MNHVFGLVSLSFDECAGVDETALSAGMEALGLARGLRSTEGRPVALPRYIFAGTFPSGDRTEVHKELHRGLNSALKSLDLHGRFFVLVSPEADWSWCHF